ncbi:MAG: hypothetical protein WDO56_01610 [Gammaproteobacteria bacterium]
MSLFETASAKKSDWLYNYYQMGRDAVEVGQPGDPYAFVIPAAQHDNPTTLKLLEVLRFGGAEIHQATASFVADGKSFAAGDFIIFSAQPYRPYVVNQLSRDKRYPDDAVPDVLRDDASWSLPLQMGVQYSEIKKPFKAEVRKLDDIPVPSVSIPSTPYLVFDTRANASYAVAFALQKKNAVYRSRGALEAAGATLPAGSFIVESTAQVKQALPALLEKWHVGAYGLDSIRNLDIQPLPKPRIGVYQSWRPNTDEGWARYVLDDLGFEFTTLHNADLKGDLTSQFSVILFANESPDRIKSRQLGRQRISTGGAGWYRCVRRCRVEGVRRQGRDDRGDRQRGQALYPRVRFAGSQRAGGSEDGGFLDTVFAGSHRSGQHAAVGLRHAGRSHRDVHSKRRFQSGGARGR